MPLGALLRLLRPKQWTKNLLVFAGLLFTGSFSERDLVLRALLAFLAMCLASSGTYAVNDALDVERDRLHPEKRRRPVAAGEIARGVATALGVLLIAAGIGLAFVLGVASGGIVTAYLVLQVLYNALLKPRPVADVFGLSLGFILRAVLGAVAIGVAISAWLLFCTGALALLLGFAKRRHEFLTQGNGRTETRASLRGYDRSSLDALVLVSACVAAICYGIYSIESPTAEAHPSLFLTTPFVFYGICRYLFLIFARNEGGEPESILLRDPHIWGSVIGFIVVAALAMRGMEVSWIEAVPR